MERAGRLLRKMKMSPELSDPEMRARAAWAMAAGKKIAEHTRATTLVRGSLIVEVGDQVWQRQLSTLRPRLLQNLKEVLGEAVVTDIDFRPMPARRMPQKAASARPVEGIEDPVLQMLYRQSQKRQKA